MKGPAERAPLMGGAPPVGAGTRATYSGGDRARGLRALKDNMRIMPTSVAGACVCQEREMERERETRREAERVVERGREREREKCCLRSAIVCMCAFVWVLETMYMS